jgi:hypothetical protein
MSKTYRDAKFPRILRRFLQEMEWSASDLADYLWGREINSEGKRTARKRDRICVWLAGKNYPSSKHLLELHKAGVDIV